MVVKKATKKAPLEKEIQKEICQWLEDKGYLFWRHNNIPVFGRNNAGKMTFRSQSKFTPKGLPDIMIIKEGTFIGIEVKRDDKAFVRPEQLSLMARFRMNGAEYYIVHSLDEVKKLPPFDSY